MRAPALPADYPLPGAPAQAPGRVGSPSLISAMVTLALMTGLALGLGTTAWVLDHRIDPSAVRAGPWTTWPKSGTSGIDPYARAIYAQSGQIPVAAAAGVLLWANADDTGAPLTGRCSYEIAGEMPRARFWSLAAATPAGSPIENAAGRYGFTSAEVLRRSDGSFTVVASSSVRPGNWLPVSADERFTLLLRLYDAAPSSGSARLEISAAPAIRKKECR